MGYKTRSNYAGICVKACVNRNKKCKECIRYSQLEEIKDESCKLDNRRN